MARYRADEHLPYFCTITVLDWLPILIESRYIEPIIESLQYCRKHRGLQVFGYVVMPNHLHLIIGCKNPGKDVGEKGTLHRHNDPNNSESTENLHEVMRDFKRFTSRTIHDRLKKDERELLLNRLREAMQQARQRRGELGLWQSGFHPQAIYSQKVFEQKLNYLHTNPVRKGLVAAPEDWWFSSAGYYAGEPEVCMEVDHLVL